MKIQPVALAALAITGVFPSAVATKTPPLWSEFDAVQRLTIGRFAARNGIDHAICLATGNVRVTKYGEKKSLTFDCRAGDNTFERERQLTVRVTGQATFVAVWLKPQVCSDAP